MDDQGARECVARVEGLLDGLDDAGAEVVVALLELYGEGLARLVAMVPDEQALVDDELVSHLLLVHGLHPVPVGRRVQGALDEVRPYLESHGGDVELVGVEDGVARLRLEGSCNGCPSSTATLGLAIEEAIHKAAPDIERVEAEGAAPPAPLLRLEVSDRLVEPRRSWASIGDAPALEPGETAMREVGGERVLFVKLDQRLYAYHLGCPACGASVETGSLDGTLLACPSCATAFDLRRAGRPTNGGGSRNLEPVPLLVDHAGHVKVAVGAPVTA